MARENLHVAVVGATGAVGREMMRMLEVHRFPVGRLTPLASPRSAGTRLPFRDGEVEVQALHAGAFGDVDVALFSAGAPRSREFGPVAVKAGAVVIDNSSAFRMDPAVPLVVPEVNGAALRSHRGLIANPNCSTAQMVLPLQALAQRTRLRRVIVSSYQSASGAGQGGIEELLSATRAALAGEKAEHHIFPRSIAFDCIPRIGSFEPSGYTTEEEKMLFETRKIMGLPDLPVSATCVRVPVRRGHQEAVTVDLEERISQSEARRILAAFPGIVVMDDAGTGLFPTAVDCDGRCETFVGRVREDMALPATLHFWCVSDNLLKGAAWNAVQIAWSLLEQDLLRVA